MTRPEFNRLKTWSKTNSVNGYMLLSPSAIELFTKPSALMKKSASENKDLFVKPKQQFVIKETHVEFVNQYIDNVTGEQVKEKLAVPFSMIKKTAIGGYNN